MTSLSEFWTVIVVSALEFLVKLINLYRSIRIRIRLEGHQQFVTDYWVAIILDGRRPDNCNVQNLAHHPGCFVWTTVRLVKTYSPVDRVVWHKFILSHWQMVYHLFQILNCPYTKFAQNGYRWQKYACYLELFCTRTITCACTQHSTYHHMEVHVHVYLSFNMLITVFDMYQYIGYIS